MRILVCFWLLAASGFAGVVQGTVMEYASSYALARTSVRLVPVPRADNVDQRQMQLRTGSAGQFVFFNVPDGYYFLISTREGYFPGAYGQRRPNGQGTPILVTKDSDLFAQLRMHRKGAITGRVLDENNVGIEGVPVVAYRARLPLRVVAQGVSDDRGVYRIHGLDSGKYWVRSAAHTLDDGSGVLPTFSPQSREMRDARAYDVRLDDDTLDADVRVEFGRLFTLGGALQCTEGPVKVTLTSETMRRVTNSSCGSAYQFTDLSPALYEIEAEAPVPKEAAAMELFVDKTNTSATVILQPIPRVHFEMNKPATVTGRRADLYDSAQEQKIDTPNTFLAPGHWEFAAQAGPDQYIESISSPFQVRRARAAEKSAEWFDVFIEMRPSVPVPVRVAVLDKAGQITGVVTQDGRAVPGAPVFLWAVDEGSRRSLKGYQAAIADTEGHYRFTGLPPGDYRIFSTYDFTEIDEASVEEAGAITVHASESQRTEANLTVWVAP
jgi:hypothetical protein